MNRLWVKVCGLRSPADVEVAVAAGAAAGGAVFHPASARHLGRERAREVSAAVL